MPEAWDSLFGVRGSKGFENLRSAIEEEEFTMFDFEK
jgi:hypothetical protein